MERVIFHLDLDAFFVSVERILDPTLEGKPVIVGANPDSRRGVISACSYEARKYGLHSAMPIGQAYKLCPNGIYLRGSYGEYARYSRLVRNILSRYAPVLKQASVDEFYMDFSGCRATYGAPIDLATHLQKEIWNELSLPASIGIASNTSVAKVCSDFHKPMGITYVIPGMEREFLAPLPIEALPGIGKVTQRELNAKGFFKLGDIARAPVEYFTIALGKVGQELWERANGEGNTVISGEHEQKSISKEHTFGKDETDIDKMKGMLFSMSGEVAQSLRKQGVMATNVILKLRYSDFTTLTRTVKISPDDDDKIFYEAVLRLFEKNYTRRVSVRLLGVGVANLTHAGYQEDMFDEQAGKRKRVLSAVDELRDRFGDHYIKIGAGL